MFMGWAPGPNWRSRPSEWRGMQCPAREAGLSHTQSNMLRPDGSCIHCGRMLHVTPPDGVPDTASEAGLPREQWATIFDHLYVFAISGRCARKGCSKIKEEHADFLIGDEGSSCVVDHSSIQPWAVCPICNDSVEPKLATGELGGKPGERGRLPYTNREMKRLERIAAAWRAGYYKS